MVHKIDFDFTSSGYALCIIDTGGDHADLTDAYAAVIQEMKDVCAFFGEEQLRSVAKMEFYSNFLELRRIVGDRAVLRAIHVYDENQRVILQRQALEDGEFDSFLAYVTESGLSSWRLLQNVIPVGHRVKQEVAVALTIAEKLLNGLPYPWRWLCRYNSGLCSQ